jgi:anti-sigma-K factor RskA
MDKHRHPTKNTQHLADLTDELLAGKRPEEPVASSADRELTGLLATVRSIHRNFPPREPETAVRNRIHARLAVEWDVTGPGSRPAGETWRSSRQVRQALVAWAAVVVVALILIGVFVAPRIPSGVTGAAQSPGGMLVLVLAGLGIIAFVLWRYRRKP